MYKKILAPLDGSELAECALEHVNAIAKGCKVPEVIFIRVVEPVYSGVAALPEGGIMYAEMIKQNEKEAESYIAGITEKFKQKYSISAQSVLANGNVAEEILEYVKKYNVDLIIMTTHGRSGVSRFLFGSVADKVSRHSPVPVLIISPPGCRLGAEQLA